MKFGVKTEKSKLIKQYLKDCDNSFSKNNTAKRVVSRKFKVKQQRDSLIIGVDYFSIFPSFRMISLYVLGVGMLLYFMFKFTLIPAIFGALILNVPDIIQHPIFLYLVMRGMIKKRGYKGKIQYLTEKQIGGVIKW